MALKDIVVTQGKISYDAVKEVPSFAEIDLISINRGIIFLFAAWSPFPYLCLQKLSSFLPEIIHSKNISIYLIDWDAISPDEMRGRLGKLSHTGAVTVWVKDGQIQGTLDGCQNNYEIDARSLTALLG